MAKRHDRRALVMNGTGAEILRGINWRPGDDEAGTLDVEILLGRARLPRAPRIVTEAERWLANLPPCPGSGHWTSPRST